MIQTRTLASVVAVMLSAHLAAALVHAAQDLDAALVTTPQSVLLPSDPQSSAMFGGAVVVDGDTALIGSIFGGGFKGAVYVFVRSGGAWIEQAKLLGRVAAIPEGFGTSVALGGDLAFVGAPGEDTGAGAVYVFQRTGTTWQQVARLVAPVRRNYDAFGQSVAIQGDTLLVGSPNEPSTPSYNGPGAAHAFVGGGAQWSLQATLTASDGASGGGSRGSAGGDRFGAAIAFSGDLAVIGAPADDIGVNRQQGSAYTFERTGITWAERQKLSAGTPATYAGFGASVALQGATILVAAPSREDSPPGSAYVFVSNGGLWTQQARLTPTDSRTVSAFASSVALQGDRAVVTGTFLTRSISSRQYAGRPIATGFRRQWPTPSVAAAARGRRRTGSPGSRAV